MRWISHLKLSQKVMLLISCTLVAGTTVALLVQWRSAYRAAVEQGVRHAKGTIGQYQTIRKYYTANVVTKARKAGVKASADYAAKDDEIPLPATLVHDLSEEFARSGEGPSLSLYSDFPFPNRNGRKLDDFNRKALAYFRERPTADSFVEVEAQRVRVATPDRMVNETCVSCHNSHAQSPKRDWKIGDLRGVLEVDESLGPALAASDAATRTTGAILALSALFLLGVASLIMRGVARRLGHAATTANGLANGDLTVDIAVEGRDEIGEMSAALSRAIGSMRSTLAEVQSVSWDVSSQAKSLATSSQQISTGAQEQAGALEEVAATLEQISATVRQNADNAQRALKLSAGAHDAAEEGHHVVGAAVSSMNAITGSSKRIADIVTTIDEISFQINLLALNAAIEAARAGEQGRGFAVVAAEVRSLAQRTSVASREVRGLITEAAQKVESGTAHVDQSGESLGKIVGSVKRVTDMMGEIAAASREQHTGVEQVTASVTEVDKITQSNASETEALSTTAQALSAKAARLQELVSAFELGTAVDARRSEPPAARSETELRAHRPIPSVAPPAASETRQRRAAPVAERPAARRVGSFR